ncbi:MAG: MFS transporter [Proteobacteria bacterium]|nr:MFS transporter [Pseudomonadota bacterium]
MNSTDPESTKWAGVFFGVTLGILAGYQFFKLPPVLPQLLATYQYDLVLGGGLMSIFALIGLIASPFFGRKMAGKQLLDYLLYATYLFIAGNLLGLYGVHSGFLMMTSRALEGIAFSIIAVAGAVITVANANIRHKPFALSLWATWIPLGQIMAGLAALPMSAEYAWRGLWWIAAFFTIFLALGGLTLDRCNLINLFAPDTRSDNQTISTKDDLRYRQVAIIFSIWAGQFTAFMTWLPHLMRDLGGMNFTQSAQQFMVSPIATATATLAMGFMMRKKINSILILAFALMVQALIWLMINYVKSPEMFALLLLIHGFALGTSAATLFALPQLITGQPVNTRAIAALMTGRSIGIMIAPVLLAQIFDIFRSWEITTYVFSAFCMICVIGTLMLSHSTKKQNAIQ